MAASIHLWSHAASLLDVHITLGAAQTSSAPMAEFDYDYMEYEDGTTGLLFTPPETTAFKSLGDGGSAHDWRQLVEYFLPRVAPEAMEGTQFDCEADLFVAISKNPKALHEIAAVLSALWNDQDSLRIVARGAFHAK